MLKIYLGEDEIKGRIKVLADEIRRDIKDKKDVVFIANLKGSIIFFSDILRELSDCDVMIDFISTESYSGKETTGNIKIVRDISLDIYGKEVVLFEDIVDTGLTLQSLVRYINEIHKPASLKLAVLLDKPSRRLVDLKIDYVGFVIENYFVVGYGMDYNEKYRNLPYIAVLDL